MKQLKPARKSDTTLFDQIINETPLDVILEAQYLLDVTERIHELIQKKFDGKQKHLALALGKSEAEISKWLGNPQNFTLKTLAKLHAVFSERVIAICTDSHESDYVLATVPVNENTKKMFIDIDEGVISKITKPSFVPAKPSFESLSDLYQDQLS